MMSFVPGLFNSSLGNARFLTGQVTQVIEFRTANLTILVDGDALNEGAVHRKDTLNADIAGHLANRETLLVLRAVNGNHIAPELLNTFLVTFLDTIGDGNLVTCRKSRKFFLLAGKRLFGNLHQIHCSEIGLMVTSVIVYATVLRFPEPEYLPVVPL